MHNEIGALRDTYVHTYVAVLYLAFLLTMSHKSHIISSMKKRAPEHGSGHFISSREPPRRRSGRLKAMAPVVAEENPPRASKMWVG